jgi:hypothetical protein
MTCVALGFSLIENYSYATRTPDSGILLFLRLFISTPAHILFSIFMGIAFFDIMKLRTGVGILLVSFCYASLVHGLFNAIIFERWILVFLGILMCFSRAWALSLLSYTTAKSPFSTDLKNFIANSKTQKITGLECLNCRSINDKDTYVGKRFFIQKCDQCPSYISTKDSLFKIFCFFGSVFKDPTRYYWDAKFYKRPYSTLYKGNSVSDQKNLAFFLLDELNEALNELNRSTVTNFERNWWFPKKLRSTPDTEESKNHEDTRSKNPLFITTLLMVVIITLVIALVDLDRESWFGLLFLGYPFLIFFYLILYLLVKLFVKTRKA